MGLTKVLKKSVSNEFQLKANFDITWFTKTVNSNEDFIIKNFTRLVRTSGQQVATDDGWPTPSMKSVLKRVFNTYIAQNPAHDLKEINLDIEKISLFNLTNLESTIEDLTKESKTSTTEFSEAICTAELFGPTEHAINNRYVPANMLNCSGVVFFSVPTKRPKILSRNISWLFKKFKTSRSFNY